MNDPIRVFKEDIAFQKLFSLFKEKYCSLGRVGGNVSLQTFSEGELESISGFLGQPSEKLRQKGSVPMLTFEKELSNTGFAEYTLVQLLEAVLGETIRTKKEQSETEEASEKSFFETLEQAIPIASEWLQHIQGKSPDTRWIWSLYRQNKEELLEKILIVSKAFASLPKKNESERLPFFSQRTTGNPHYFDQHEPAGKLLLHRMYVDQLIKGKTEANMPKSTEELNDVLSDYGILRDDLWNFVTCQGIIASYQDEVHPVWKAAVQTKTVMNVPMKELMKVDRIWPNIGMDVWVVENSSVCSTIMDAVPNAAIVCTHGQLRTASWRLLDFLFQSNCTLHYSGDLDPEGILIAEKLKKRYNEKVVLWRMNKEAYEMSVSDEDISGRLSKLDGATSPEWGELTSLMREVKKAGYQEAIVSLLIEDITE
ncbi:TIGR02679 domain-containing protein [Bacillus luti]|nr:TIGR02679 family protein [Bacillus cereus]HDR8329659.1 TIGR02679 family protein [Bacillus cereus]HDR8337041.1 TIGR02679 family protein [Bacillus cereus]